MRMVNVLVERSEHLAIPRAVGAWEVPVLELVHGTDKVRVLDTVTEVNRELPDPLAEFERLERRYGRDEESGRSWVSQAYAGARGINDLERAMQDSQAAVEEADPLA